MPPRYRSFQDIRARLSRSIAQTSAGGSWTNQLTEGARASLRWFYFDGLFASASDAITLTYLTLYLLALGATSAQIGFMTALASLSAAALLVPGAMLSERLRSRKGLILASGGGVTRSMLLLLALTPLIFKGSSAILVMIAFKLVADGFANLSIPAWISLTADLVPLKYRGHYFGSRNLIMGISNMIMVLLVGAMITHIGSPAGYQLAFGLAFAIGMISTFSFSHIQEPQPAAPRTVQPTYTPASLLHTLSADRRFLAFCAHAMLWTISLNVAGPFFNVHLVQNLKATAVMVGITSIVSSLTGLPGMRLFGRWADQWGPRKVQLITGLVIPVLPLAWAIIRAPWQVILINILGGFIWAGYNLSSFNFLLLLTPNEQRARYSALFQIVVTLSTAVGAALGGLITMHWSYPTVFVISGLGRIAAMAIFARFVREPGVAPEMILEEAQAL